VASATPRDESTVPIDIQQQQRMQSPARPLLEPHSSFKAGPSSSPVPKLQQKFVAPNPQQHHNTKTSGVGNWQEVLDSNKAGAASNAEDFTKQFMNDFFGKQSGTKLLCF